MRYPELQLSMETALPPSIQSWLGHELEIRGIDSVIYSRYIVQLLQDDDLDELGCPDYMDLIFSQKLDGKRVKGRKYDRHKIDSEERKKNAAIQCLQAVSEEDSGIETLVEELSYKLKEISSSSGTEADTDTTADVSCSSTDSSDNSSSELDDPTERYYAAFPALQGQDKQTSLQSPFDKDSVDVWQKNPITNLQAGSDDISTKVIDSGNESENDDPAKNQKENKIQELGPRKKKQHGKKFAKGYPMKKNRKSSSYIHRVRSVPDEKSKADVSRKHRLSSWPQQSICYSSSAPPSSSMENEELCYKVESLLKEILLPSHAWEPFPKAGDCCYYPDVQRNERKEIELDNKREESVSPELRENDSWYTQPLEALFYPDEHRYPLYKRHSNPLLADEDDQQEAQIELEKTDVCSCGNDIENEGNTMLPTIHSELCLSLEAVSGRSIPSELTNLMENNNESACLDSPCPSGKSLQSTSCLDQKSIKYSSGSSTSTCSSASYATVTERSKDLEDRKDEFATPPQLCPVFETWESPTVFMNMPTLLDRDYLFGLISSQLDLTNADCFPARQGFLCSPASVTTGENCSEDIGWSSKVLFDDQLHLPPEFQISRDTFGGCASVFRPLSQGKMFRQLWDVNYQKQANEALLYPWKLEELWDFDNSYNSSFWSTTTTTTSTLFGFGNWIDDWSSKISLPLSDNVENTLIPEITFDLAPDNDLDDVFVIDDDVDEDEAILNHLLEDDPMYRTYNRSISLGDFQVLWSTDEQSHLSKPQLSKSFELVPSEHSAFEDVPSKMFHVQSEPNLKYFCEAADSGLKQLHLQTEDKVEEDKKQSPEEHLYYSPKTHFRPIQTPVQTQDTMSDFHLRDLFGGYSKTNKTPYQKYQDHGSDSGEESFVPKFKIKKDFDKYIQTGDEVHETEEYCSHNTNCYPYDDREIDELVQAIAAKGCLDDGDLTSPYENLDNFFIGNVDSLISSQINTPQNVGDYWNQACSDSGYEEAEVAGNVEEERIDRRTLQDSDGRDHLYPVNDYSQVKENQVLEEFQAKEIQVDNVKRNEMEAKNENELISCFPVNLEVEQEEQLPSSFHEIGSWLFHDKWSADASDHVDPSTGLRRPSIWSSNQDEVDLVSGDNLLPTDELACYVDENVLDTDLDYYIPDAYFPHIENIADEMENPSEAEVGTHDNQRSGVVYPSVIHRPVEDSGVEKTDSDIVKVKLVFRKGTRNPQHCIGEDKKLLDPKSLMPMPTQAVYSSELEKEWLNTESYPQLCYKTNKSSANKDAQRKPCSFFMEGNCRRADCKFAHDLSLITCKFWEGGDCFKGEMCPFLHGYYRYVGAGDKTDKDKYEFQSEDFPELKSQSSNVKTTEPAKLGNKEKKSGTASPRSSEYRKNNSKSSYRKKEDKKNIKSEDKKNIKSEDKKNKHLPFDRDNVT